MTISRQHANTELPELSELTCRCICAVGTKDLSKLTVFYALIEGVWHRFFLDAGLLFWEEGVGPDAEEDLSDELMYINLNQELRLKDSTIGEIIMCNNRLVIRFLEGAEIVLEDQEDRTVVVKKVSHSDDS